jgi:predicted enzyme related to lactoylglutathione lyase
MPTSFSHIQLYVTNLKRALLWYERVLAFTPAYVAEPHYARMLCEPMNLTIALHFAHDPKDVGRGAIPYLQSDDFDAFLARLKDLKVSVDEPRREGDSPRFTSFIDCEGNRWGVEEA